MTNLYEVTADYRPNNLNKPKYYVVAASKKESREKFSSVISWLKIYTVDLVGRDIAEQIVKHPDKHIIIGGTL